MVQHLKHIILWAIAAFILSFTHAYSLQQFESENHGTISAVISAQEVSRISVLDDRIRSIVGVPPQGWSLEHDRITGDLFLIPLTADLRPLSLFIQTQQDYSYQLNLAVEAISAQQILIKNKHAGIDSEASAALWQSQPRVQVLTQIVQALRQDNLSTSLFSRRSPRTGELENIHPDIQEIVIYAVWESEEFTAYQLSLYATDRLRADQLISPAAAIWVSEPDEAGISQAIIIQENADG